MSTFHAKHCGSYSENCTVPFIAHGIGMKTHQLDNFHTLQVDFIYEIEIFVLERWLRGSGCALLLRGPLAPKLGGL